MAAAPETNLLAVIEGKEQYFFLYDDASKAELLRVFGRFAANPELNFTWLSAAKASQRVRLKSISKPRRKP
jgi:hypothetical protein